MHVLMIYGFPLALEQQMLLQFTKSFPATHNEFLDRQSNSHIIN